MPIYPSGWIATVVSVLERMSQCPFGGWVVQNKCKCTRAGKFPTHLPFWGSVLPVGLHFYTFRYLWRNWVIVPTWVQICTNRTSANICRPKHRMLTLILRGEGWSQGDPSRLGRSVAHMQHLPTYHAARIPTGILTGVYDFMGGLYSRKFTHHTDHYLV